jgi:hypothetical protein
VADSNSGRFQQCDEGIGSVPEFDKDGADGGMGDSDSGGCVISEEQHGKQEVDTTDRDSRGQHFDRSSDDMWSDRLANTNGIRSLDGINREEGQGPEAITKHCSSGWPDFSLVACRDGKTRRVPTEPAFFPLAHGISARVVRLRGYGNAIVPQVAAEFAKAYLEISQ